MNWRQSTVLLFTGLCNVAFCEIFNIQYFFIGNPLTWNDAQTFCREQFTDLATIYSLEQKAQLLQRVEQATGGFTEVAWIGLFEDIFNFRWSLEDEEFCGPKGCVFRSFAPNEPNNYGGNQRCVSMRKTEWDDRQCSERLPFVCYDGSPYAELPYILVKEKMTWLEAQMYCRSKCTDLVTIRNALENEQISCLIDGHRVWIGLFRNQEWSDGSLSPFRFWADGQPDVSGGDVSCTVFQPSNSGRWMDESCSRTLPFVCYGVPQQLLEVTFRFNADQRLDVQFIRENLLIQLNQILIGMGVSGDINLNIITVAAVAAMGSD